jgi:hypothetical protein
MIRLPLLMIFARFPRGKLAPLTNDRFRICDDGK